MLKVERFDDLPDGDTERPKLSKKEIQVLKRQVKEKEAAIIKTIRTLEGQKQKAGETGFVEQLGNMIEGWKAMAEEISADYLRLEKSDESKIWSRKARMLERYLEKLTSPKDLADSATGNDNIIAIKDVSEIIDELCQMLDHRVIPVSDDPKVIEPTLGQPEKPTESVTTQEDLFREIESSGWEKRIINKVKRDVQAIIDWTTSKKFKILNPRAEQQVAALEATFKDRFEHFDRANGAFKQDLFTVLEGLGVKTKLDPIQPEKPPKSEDLELKEVKTKADLFANMEKVGKITGVDKPIEEIKGLIEQIISDFKNKQLPPRVVHDAIREKLGDQLRPGFKSDLLTVLNAEGIQTRRDRNEASRQIDFRGVSTKEELFERLRTEVPTGTMFKMPKTEGFNYSEQEVPCDTLIGIIDSSFTYFASEKFKKSSTELKKARAELALNVVPDQYGLREAMTTLWKKMGLYEFDPTIKIKTGGMESKETPRGPLKAEIIDLSNLPLELTNSLIGVRNFKAFLRRLDVYILEHNSLKGKLGQLRAVCAKAFEYFQGPDFARKTGVERTVAITKFVGRFDNYDFREDLARLVEEMVPEPKTVSTLKVGNSTVPEEPDMGLEVKLVDLEKEAERNQGKRVMSRSTVPPVIATFAETPGMLVLLQDKAFATFFTKYPDSKKLVSEENEVEIKRRYEVFKACPTIINDLTVFSAEMVQSNFMFPLSEKLVGKGANLKESFAAFVGNEAIQNPERLLELKAQMDQYKQQQLDIQQAQKDIAALNSKDRIKEVLDSHKVKKQDLEDALKTTGFGWKTQKTLKLFIESFLVKGKTKESIEAETQTKIEALPEGPEREKNERVLKEKMVKELAAFESFQYDKRLMDSRERVQKNYNTSFSRAKINEELKNLEKIIDDFTKLQQKVSDLEAFAAQKQADLRTLRVELLEEVGPIKAVVKFAQWQVNKLVTVFGQDDSLPELESKLEYMTKLMAMSAEGQANEVDQFAQFAAPEDTAEAVRRLQVTIERRVNKEFVEALQRPLATSDPANKLEQSILGILQKAKIGLPEGEEKQKLLGKIFADTITILEKKKDPDSELKCLWLRVIAIKHKITIK